VKRIIVWSNTVYAVEYSADIELDTGKVLYKTNEIIASKIDECFFIVPQIRMNIFKQTLNILDKWQSLYGEKDSLCIDGYYWTIEIIGDSPREIKGFNAKPDNFVEFIISLENLLQKNFSYKSLQDKTNYLYNWR